MKESLELQVQNLIESKPLEISPDNRVVLNQQYEESLYKLNMLIDKLQSLKKQLDVKLLNEMTNFNAGKKIEGDKVSITKVDKKRYKLNIDIKEALMDKELRKLIKKEPKLDTKKLAQLDELPPEIDLIITSELRIKHG